MFSLDLESRILSRAQEKGLLKDASTETLDPKQLLDPFSLQASSMWGPRLDALVNEGRLAAEDVASMAFELISPGATEEPGQVNHPQPALPSIGPRYEQLKLVGEGATSHVYRAFDTLLSRWVALKFLKVEVGALALETLNEARAQAQVEHPNVCRVYEVGNDEGHAFIAMQLVEGQTLAKVFRDLDLRSKIRMVRDLAEGVHAAHRKGLIHLDLKPGNVLVQTSESGECTPLLSDFGMMRSESSPAVGPCPMGTPPYSSPEQIAGDLSKVDRRSDVYSLGVLLYVLLTQTFPFEAETFSELLDAIRHRRPIPLRKRLNKASEDLDAILDRCLKKDPTQRYDSAQALADDLQRYLDNEPVHAKHHSFRYRLSRWKTRNRKFAAAILIGSLGILITGSVLGYAAWFSKRQGEWAQKFEQDVDQWDSFLHRIYALPAHDIRPELAQAKDGLRKMEAEVELGGRTAQGPGHYALGRMEQLLGNTEGWWSHSEKAWAIGYRTPQSMTSRAEILLEKYNVYKEMIQGNASFRSEQEARLRRAFLDPAFDLFAKANTSLQGQMLSLANIQVAMKKEDFTKAITLAETYRQERSWDYESWQIEADVRRRRVWNMAVKNELIGIRNSVYGKQAKDRSMVPEMRAELDRAALLDQEALRLSPSRPESYAQRVETLRYRTMLQLTDGEDVGRVNAEVEKVIQAGLQTNPESLSLRHLMHVYLRASVLPYLWQQGCDPRAILRHMEDLTTPRVGEHANPVALYASMYDSSAVAWTFGDSELPKSQNLLDRIEESYRSKTSPWSLDERAYVFAMAGSAPMAVARVEWECGIDPAPNLERALRWAKAGETCFVPQHTSALQHSIWITKAEVEVAMGRDPKPSLEKAQDAMAKGLKEESINPDQSLISECRMARVRFQHAPTPVHQEALLQAIQPLQRRASDSTRARPQRYRDFLEIGKSDLLLAKLALDHSGSDGGFLQPARKALDEGLAFFPESTELPERLAEWALLKVRTPSGSKVMLDEGLVAAERALHYPQPLTEAECKAGKRRPLPPQGMELPHQARSLRFKGEILWELAKLEKDPSARAQKIREAEVVLSEALKRNPFLAREINPLLAAIRSSLAATN